MAGRNSFADIACGHYNECNLSIFRGSQDDDAGADFLFKFVGKVSETGTVSCPHDIGKDLVHMLMDINGFEVRDLGVDVPASRFCEEYQDFQPDIIGLSGLLTLSYKSMKSVVDGLKEIGVRDRVKVIIGGGQVDEQACNYVGADAWVTDAVAGKLNSIPASY